jgi:hypothetical protein
MHSFQLLSFSFLLPDAQGVPVPNQAHTDLGSLHLFIPLVCRSSIRNTLLPPVLVWFNVC